MAIARGAGTEIIRAHHFTIVNANQKLIIGEQHHVYTVLSIVVYCALIDSTTDKIMVRLVGFDSHGGSSAQEPIIFNANPQAGETFVWNDKFSFNGFEPTGASGSFGAGDAAADLAYQNAIADQGGSAVQSLEAIPETDANYSITVTFIDQNNA